MRTFVGEREWSANGLKDMMTLRRGLRQELLTPNYASWDANTIGRYFSLSAKAGASELNKYPHTSPKFLFFFK